MTKRYRLNIPEKVYGYLREDVQDMDGLTDEYEKWGSDFHQLGWLTEIKEPLSFDDWFKKWFSHYYPDRNINDQLELKVNLCNSWNAALENQKLGVVVDEDADNEAYCEWIKNISPSDNDIWRAALKYARGSHE